MKSIYSPDRKDNLAYNEKLLEIYVKRIKISKYEGNDFSSLLDITLATENDNAKIEIYKKTIEKYILKAIKEIKELEIVNLRSWVLDLVSIENIANINSLKIKKKFKDFKN